MCLRHGVDCRHLPGVGDMVISFIQPADHACTVRLYTFVYCTNPYSNGKAGEAKAGCCRVAGGPSVPCVQMYGTVRHVGTAIDSTSGLQHVHLWQLGSYQQR